MLLFDHEVSSSASLWMYFVSSLSATKRAELSRSAFEHHFQRYLVSGTACSYPTPYSAHSLSKLGLDALQNCNYLFKFNPWTIQKVYPHHFKVSKSQLLQTWSSRVLTPCDLGRLILRVLRLHEASTLYYLQATRACLEATKSTIGAKARKEAINGVEECIIPECCCQICAVSINIARLRTRHEPPEDGWGYSGSVYYDGDDTWCVCARSKHLSRCEVVENEDPEMPATHFPGPGCSYDGGYSGWRITAAEMRTMNTPRYIVRKPKNWVGVQEDELDYERDSEFFLTTKTMGVPDDFEPGELERQRYGVDTLYSQNYEVIDEDTYELGWGTPVHESCWRIFERVSRERLGRVDLQGFMGLWFRQACGTCGFKNMKHDSMIRKCKQQMWRHIAGSEYLASNPYNVPSIRPALLDQGYTDEPKGEGAFLYHTPTHGLQQTNPTDPFTKLPPELKEMILHNLSSKDIASLRLAARTFRQLPKRLFLHLIKKELPWFWEFEDVKQDYKERDADIYANMYPEWSRELQAKKLQERFEEYEKLEINWMEVYTKLVTMRKGILGVRNRARVWGLAEEIVRRIAVMREEEEKKGNFLREAVATGTVFGTLGLEPVREKHTDLYCASCSFDFMGANEDPAGEEGEEGAMVEA